MSTPPATRARTASPWLFAGAWTAVAAVPIYATIRGVQKLLLHEPNPATVIWSAHSGFFWRSWTVFYASGATYAVAFLLAKRAPQKTARALPWGIALGALVLVVQALLAP